jgi:diguanylate cyclase (GGDEF)-like protein
MKKVILSLILSVTALFSSGIVENSSFLSDKEIEYLKKKKIIKLCIDPNWMPFEKIDDGKHIGITKDYFDIFRARLNTPIELVQTKSWSESIERAKNRECDIFSLAMSTPSRLEYMNFTKPYIESPLVITTKIDYPFISNPIEILDKPLGIAKGYAYTEILKSKYPKIKLVEFEDLSRGLDAVREGRILGYIDNLITSGYQIQNSYIGELKIAGKFDDKWALGIGVRNDDLVLLGIFEKLVDSIGGVDYRSILNKWISVNYDSHFDYKLLIQITLLMLTFIGFLWYRQYELKKYVYLLEHKEKELIKLSITDSLTGLYNRREFDRVFEDEYNRAKRSNRRFIFLIVDIDNFKKYNDNYGHSSGDDAIISISRVLLDMTHRAGDYAFRIGGEEFAIILQSNSNYLLEDYCEELQSRVFDLNIEHKYNPPYNFVTISIGAIKIKSYDNLDRDKIYKYADSNLYLAKESGRNRAVIG